MMDQLKTMNPTARNMLATVALIVACILASLIYSGVFWWIFTREVSFRPDLASTVIALLLIVPVIRGDFLYMHRLDLHTGLNLLLIFYLTAVFVQIGLGGNSAFLAAPGFIVTLVAILLANFRPRRYGELAVVVLAVFGGMNIWSASKAMGFAGFFLALASALGVLFAVDLRKVARRIMGDSAET